MVFHKYYVFKIGKLLNTRRTMRKKDVSHGNRVLVTGMALSILKQKIYLRLSLERTYTANNVSETEFGIYQRSILGVVHG